MLRVGIIGCGNIAETYLENARLFRDFSITAVADLRTEVAAGLASRFNLRALKVDDIMRSDEIDLVLNLTVPAAHAEISLNAIEAGKHVFSEKPMATTLDDAIRINRAARDRNVRFGIAPDTVLGPATQNARRRIDDGAIGAPVSGMAAMMNRGMEQRHPNPDFFFKPGGGPVLDIGPYYISSLVLLLGSVKSVSAMGTMGFRERIISSPGNPRFGEAIKVEVMTTVQGMLRFEMGAQLAFSFSWDVASHGLAPIELYGSEASIRLPDPNFFGGKIEISRVRDVWEAIDLADEPFGRANFPASGPLLANYRGLGLAEMASAISMKRPHRANGELGLHVLETLLRINEAVESHHDVSISSTVERPALLSAEAARALMSSPAPKGPAQRLTPCYFRGFP